MSANYVHDCPRCPANDSTFDILAQNSRGIVAYDWVECFEIFSVCRACKKGTIFLIENKEFDRRDLWSNDFGIVKQNGVLNKYFTHLGFIALTDLDVDQPPEHTPTQIADIFFEGSKCLSIKCWNAAGAMFRTSIDVATNFLLPEQKENEDHELKQARKVLFHRIDWLIKEGKIHQELGELANCIRQDGNDAVHDANLSEEDALDLKDFATEMFERLYTTPERLKLAKDRRKKRREKSDDSIQTSET